MVVRVRSSPFRTLTNGNPELSTLTSDIPLSYLNSHKRNPELSTLTSDIFFPGTNSHIRKSELRTLTFDIPSGASRRLLWPHWDMVPLLQAFLLIWPVQPSPIQFLTSERIHHAATLYNL